MHWDHSSELQLRASDRRIFSRTYSRSDENFWKASIGDDLREWYAKPPRPRSTLSMSPDLGEDQPLPGYLSMPSENLSPQRHAPKLPFLAPVYAPRSDCFPHQQPAATIVAIGTKTLLRSN